MTSEQVAKVLSSLGKRKVCFQHGDKVEIVKGINVTNDNVILISELHSSTNSQNMTEIELYNELQNIEGCLKMADSQILEIRKKKNDIMNDFLSLLSFQKGDKVKDKMAISLSQNV